MTRFSYYWPEEFGIRESATFVAVSAVLFCISRWLFCFSAGLLLGVVAILYVHPFATRLDVVNDKAHRHTLDNHVSAVDSADSSSMNASLQNATSSLAQLLVQNFVLPWYGPAFPDEVEIPALCKDKLLKLAFNIHASMATKDWVFVFEIALTNMVATIASTLHDIRLARQEGLAMDQLHDYTRGHPESLLAQLLDTSHRRWLQNCTAKKMLKCFLAAEDVQCPILLLFLRNVITLHVLESATAMLAGTDAINLQIINYFAPHPTQSGLQEALETAAGRLESSLERETPSASKDIDEIPSVMVSSTPVPLRPQRGRRLSFKERLSGVESFETIHLSLGEADLKHKRKSSLLTKTSSFLSKSRSRSSSPKKPPEMMLGSSTEFRPDLYFAELLVYHTSEPDGFNDSQKQVTAKTTPELTIMISPTKQIFTNDTVAKGICIIRSMQEFEALDKRLRCLSASGNLTMFPDWSVLPSTSLESEFLAYLTDVTRNSVLARDEAFVYFCRQDLDLEGRLKALGQSNEANSPWSGRASFERPFRTGQHSRSLSPFKRTAGFRFPVNTAESQQSMRSASGATSRSTSPAKEPHQATTLNKAKSWRDNASTLETQGVVDQFMVLLTAFFALSNKTWTIRRQLLHLLRNVLFSPGSNSLQLLVKQVDSLLDYWIDGDAVAVHIREICNQLKEGAPVASELSVAESTARAETAKQLLLRQGIPQAMKSLMGATPTHEALTVLFETMQNHELMQGLLTVVLCDTLSTVINA